MQRKFFEQELMRFKFQSDSINTEFRWSSGRMKIHFKFQSDSINTLLSAIFIPSNSPLNSNLILLIRAGRMWPRQWQNYFKFQSDSINTNATAAMSANIEL